MEKQTPSFCFEKRYRCRQLDRDLTVDFYIVFYCPIFTNTRLTDLSAPRIKIRYRGLQYILHAHCRITDPDIFVPMCTTYFKYIF